MRSTKRGERECKGIEVGIEPLRVGEGRDNDQAESIRDGFSGQRETPLQGG
jgi:hypothetical protein